MLMVSSSSSSSTHPFEWTHDVFLSFRGADTRKNFTDHLYDALKRKGIRVYKDDNELERGKAIDATLWKAIEDSRFSIVIFSQGYASSPWCLDELVKIVQCLKARGHMAFPVFYGIDPSDVADQKGGYEKAFLDHETQFKKDMEKVQRWRDCLAEVAYLSGWDARNRMESKLVNEIAEKISKQLDRTSLIDSNGLIGRDLCIEHIKKLLRRGMPNNRALGIWGMGGIGKTAIAKAVFNSIIRLFESWCFLENVREESERYGLVSLRDKLHSKVLGAEHCLYNFAPEKRKALIVLDDVNDVAQVEFLTEGYAYFGPENRVIVTSRDKQVLKNIADEIYEVEGLNDDAALQLFSLSAFKGNDPIKSHVDLSKRAVKYADGNPLALKVLGSFFFDKGKEEWQSALDKLKTIPYRQIHNSLKISFDVLDDEEKAIFLDIACFFKGQQVGFVKRIWDGCGFSTEIGLRVLVDKSLIVISDSKLGMHDLLQEMAHIIVCQESVKHLGEHSRLWRSQDVCQVLTKNLGTSKVKGIFLDVAKLKEIKLSSKAFWNLHNLRLLKVYDSGVGNFSKVHFPHGLKSLPDELRYLQWERYPLRSLPSKFHPDNLVELNLSFSKVEQLWKGVEDLVNLKEVNLSYCKNLVAIPNLSRATNLERLNLESCTNLVEVPIFIRHLSKLTDLDVKHCTSLVSFPSNIKLKSLKTLNFSGCSSLKKCPEIVGEVTYLNFNETAIEELSQPIGYLKRLRALNLKDCKRLSTLPGNFHTIESLIIFDLSGCSNISKLPSLSQNIKYLYLSGTAIEELPSSIGFLSRLLVLDLAKCTRLESLPSAIRKLKSLEKLILSGCSSIARFPEVPRNTMELYLDATGITEIPSSIEYFYRLVELHLRGCTRFRKLPRSVCKVKTLQKLNLSGCSKFENFPKVSEPMESLRYLYLDGTDIRELPSPMRNLNGLSSLELGNCNLVSLPDDLRLLKKDEGFKYLRKLCLNGCNIWMLPGFDSLSSLEALDLSENNFEFLPPSIANLSDLQYLGLRCCKRLQSLGPLPPRLAKLDAHNCESLRCSKLDLRTEGDGNIFEFLFTNCFMLDVTECDRIMRYTSRKIQHYMRQLYCQAPSVPAGVSSFCFPGRTIPWWFEHQTSGSTITIQLPSTWTDSDFRGFALCALVAFKSNVDDFDFQVKCTYHLKNEYGDCLDLYSGFGGWYGRQQAYGSHLFCCYDPCLEATKVDCFGKYDTVLIQFCPEDMDDNPLHCCDVIQCGVRLFHTDHLQCDFLHLPGCSSYFIEAASTNKISREDMRLCREFIEGSEIMTEDLKMALDKIFWILVKLNKKKSFCF